MPSPFPHLPPERRGTLHTLRVHAPCLEDNPWGDPAVRDVHVHTPAGWHPGERLPAILLLAPFGNTGEGMLARSLTDVPIGARIDRLLEAGCPRFVAVLPDVMTSVGGSQFVDSPGLGRYLAYLLDAVVPAVEASFPTSGRWGVAGRSSGGLGAFNVAARDPVRFRAAALHAADAGFDVCYLGDLVPALRAIRAAGGPGPFLERFWAEERPSGDAFAALNVLAMSCAYSPDAGARPVPARLPFDWEVGALDADVLASWRAHDPVVRAGEPDVAAALRSLDLLLIDAGDHDEYLLHLGARRLVTVLRAQGVEPVHEEFAGGHRGTAWRFDHSLPRLAAALTE